MLCDHLEGWDREGGRETQEGGDMGIYIYIHIADSLCYQKLTQQCKAIKLQLRYIYIYINLSCTGQGNGMVVKDTKIYIT